MAVCPTGSKGFFGLATDLLAGASFCLEKLLACGCSIRAEGSLRFCWGIVGESRSQAFSRLDLQY